MLRDLTKTDEKTVTRRTQVCIIGAGVAGIFLAQLLRSYGVRVVLLEAGGNASLTPAESGIQCNQIGDTYNGSELGRVFGLGGTSAIWGGQLLPLTSTDLLARPQVGCDAWPISYSELIPYYEKVLYLLGLPNGMFSSEESVSQKYYSELLNFSSEFQLRLSEWLPFKKRNFAHFYDKVIKSDSELEVWINAAVVELTKGNGNDSTRLKKIVACSQTGKTLVVEADYVVVCAGTLESTRLMLAFDESSNNSISKTGAPLGNYFSDHLSVSAGKIQSINHKRYNQLTAPTFQSGVMRTPRLELSHKTQSLHHLPSAFGHFTFTTRGNTGFDIVRTWLRKRQGKIELPVSTTSSLGRVIKDMTALSFWRYYHHQLWLPPSAELLLQLDIEQTPNRDNRLYLAEERDSLKRKILAIDWRVRKEDIHTIQFVSHLINKAWQASKFQNIANLKLINTDLMELNNSLYDVYHPTGTLKMGTTPDNSVVNSDLQLWASDNVYINSTAVFPSAGSANPTFTLLAMATRLADHLNKKFI